MTQDDIIRMAREACTYTTDEMRGAFYEGFLKGAVAEREACAKIIETYRIPVGNSPAGEMACEWTHDALKEIRDAIRARGQVREHVMSGDCWCNPELNYVDPVTGVEVWVHKEPQ